MVAVIQAAAVRGPTFIRALARAAQAEVPASGPAPLERLGQWLERAPSLALSTALDGRLPEPASATPPFDDAEAAACARTRAALMGAIATPRDPACIAFAGFRQRCLDLQRALQTGTGRLRGRLRDMLAHMPAKARLAEVDAVMERILSPREHALLARVPLLLGERFEQLHAEFSDASASDWLDAFHRDMQDVLRAELDLRFHPIDGLLAALRTR